MSYIKKSCKNIPIASVSTKFPPLRFKAPQNKTATKTFHLTEEQNEFSEQPCFENLLQRKLTKDNELTTCCIVLSTLKSGGTIMVREHSEVFDYIHLEK